MTFMGILSLYRWNCLLEGPSRLVSGGRLCSELYYVEPATSSENGKMDCQETVSASILHNAYNYTTFL